MRSGEISAPLDSRYLKKGLPADTKPSDTSRPRVVSFLRQIYDSVAEKLPDVRDDGYDDFQNPSVVLEVPELSDPYTRALNQGEMKSESEVKPMSRKTGKTKTRKKKKSVYINPGRKDEEERFLPPGHMKDYWEQMLAAEAPSDLPPVAFSTFWRVWYQDFHFMKFRPQSSHAMCSTCLRHKMIIKSLTNHSKARQEQQRLFTAHLRSQYCDRLVYWELRARSRARSPFEVTLILDGVDQAKFTYPRSDVFRSKDLASVQRPRAHVSGLICHGRFILFTVSPSNVPKDANSCIETTAHALELLAKEIDLSMIILNINSDNTSREVKNNFYIRWLASLVSHGVPASNNLFLLAWTLAMRTAPPSPLRPNKRLWKIAGCSSADASVLVQCWDL